MLFIYYLFVFEVVHLILYGFYRITMKIPLLGAIYRFFEHIGVYFHEIAHIILMKLTFSHAIITRVRIHEGAGEVRYRYAKHPSFFQVFFQNFAPLILGTELILFITYLFTFSGIGLSLGSRIVLFILGFSILEVLSPSWRDVQNVWEYLFESPMISLRQILFMGVGWFLQIKTMEYFNLIANPMLEFPIFLGILGGLELIFALIMRLFRFNRRSYSQTGNAPIEISYDPVVRHYIEQDLMAYKSKMTTSDDPRFRQRFAELMDAVAKENSSK